MKKLLFVAILSLTLTCVGCGSSGNSNPITSPSPSAIPYSSDYFGLEPGFELTYQVSDTDIDTANGETQKSTITLNIIDLGDGIFKWVCDNNLSAGDLILKKNNSYYYYGRWHSNGNDEIYSEPYHLFVSNPVTTSMSGSEFGTVKGKEPVTVKGGTFTAWVFEEVDDYQVSNNTFKCVNKVWFVPYLGIVKTTHNDWKNGEHIADYIAEFTSSTKGVKVQDTSLKSVQSQNVAPLKSGAPSSLMQLFGKHVH